MPARSHSIATLAAELRTDHPALTDDRAATLARTLCREITRTSALWQAAPLDMPVPADLRRKVIDKARKLYR